MISLPAVFSDDMVLQQNKPIEIWGKTDAGSLQLSFHDIVMDIAVENGKFRTFIPEQKAGGPYVLKIWSEQERLVFDNVMVGEVWIAGGQSNMELELVNSLHGEDIVKHIENPMVRFYYTPKISWVGEELLDAERNSKWELCSPDTAGRWSAVGYYYASELARRLNVVVGVIGCNWGGTSASCWTSMESLKNNPTIASYAEEYEERTAGLNEDSYIKEWKDYLIYQAEFDKKVGYYYQTAENPNWDEAIRLFGESRYPGPMGPRNFTRPGGLYESMLSRICPYTVSGVIFYQGEEDDHKPYSYKELLTTMIHTWREDWHDSSLPFLLVQLPVFLGEQDEDGMNWPFIREAQMDVSQTVNQVKLTTILDLGEKRNIHPLNKQTVGERLAKIALSEIYRKPDVTDIYGPVYSGFELKANQMILSFDYAEEGFVCTSDTVNGFEIAGDDKIYYPADVHFTGQHIIIESPKVEAPKYARYGWANYFDVNLFGRNLLPVAPFRTGRDDGAKAVSGRNGLVQD